MTDTARAVRDLTSFIMHKHYCENDSEAIIPLIEDPFSWFGPGEKEYVVSKERMAEVLRQLRGAAPRCNIFGEEYDVLTMAPDIYLCTGRMWIATDPSAKTYLRVHQRVTAMFFRTRAGMRCRHIHLSNPYMEMTESDTGFPTRIGGQSCEYLQQLMREQKRQIEAQIATLGRLDFEDSRTGLFNRNKFNQETELRKNIHCDRLGVACFDLNSLKSVNRQLGHIAGDQMICCMARHIQRAFEGKAYRIGGGKFVVVDQESERDAFYALVDSICRQAVEDQISVSAGLSWRSAQCSIEDQLEEADRLMHREKARFYRSRQDK